jgi:hypothetical protein
MNFFGCHERSPVKVIVQRNILNLGDMRISDQDRQGLHPTLTARLAMKSPIGGRLLIKPMQAFA